MFYVYMLWTFYVRFAYPDICISGYTGYDTKQSDSEAPVMLELREDVKYLFIDIPLSQLLVRVVAPDRVLSMNQIELFDI